MEIGGGAYGVGEGELILVEEEDEVLQPDDAQHVVKRTVDHRIGLEEVLLEDCLNLVLRVVDVERHRVGAVGHERADLEVAQEEHPLHDVLLHLLHFAVFLSFLHNRLDFLFRHFALGFLDAEQVEHHLGALRQNPHEGCGDEGEEVHRACDGLRGFLRQTQSDALRYKFTEDDGQVGHKDDDDGLCRQSGIGGREAGIRQQLGEVVGKCGAGVDTGQDADEGDTDLYGGEEAVGVVGKFQRHLGGLASLLEVGREARLTRGDDRYFRHGKDAVKENE